MNFYCVRRAPLLLLRSWVALSVKVCLWVRYRWHPTKSPLFSISKGIQALPILTQCYQELTGTTLYWRGTTKYQPLTYYTDPAYSFIISYLSQLDLVSNIPLIPVPQSDDGSMSQIEFTSKTSHELQSLSSFTVLLSGSWKRFPESKSVKRVDYPEECQFHCMPELSGVW